MFRATRVILVKFSSFIQIKPTTFLQNIEWSEIYHQLINILYEFTLNYDNIINKSEQQSIICD